MFSQGWTDGLPVIPPTESRINRMLEGTTRSVEEIVCLVPPNLVECTVEKVAINAVMAGCLPEYLPVVLSALEAICSEEFNMHGVIATTMSVGPIFIVNGPIATGIGMNSGINALGQGNRANSSIGRAVQLTVRNIGGGLPGGIDRATLGHMGKQGLCFAENETDSPWKTLAETKGFERNQNVITAFCGEGPRIVVDQKSRSPESLTRFFAEALRQTISPRIVMAFDALLVLSPEHMSKYVNAGWSREKFLKEITQLLVIETDSIISGADGIQEGLPKHMAGMKLPKFQPEGLLVAHAGGSAGLFSAIIGGWLNSSLGSTPVTKEIKL